MSKVKKINIIDYPFNIYPLYEELPDGIKNLLTISNGDIEKYKDKNKYVILSYQVIKSYLKNITTKDLIKNIKLDFENRDPEKVDIIRNELIERGEILNMDYLTVDKFYYIIQDYKYKKFLLFNKM
jgi:hypothetical protein